MLPCSITETAPVTRFPPQRAGSRRAGEFRLLRKRLRIQNRTLPQGQRASSLFRAVRQKGNKTFPKSNRMPDAPHSVKVVAEVVDGIQNLRQHFVGRIKMT